jgi:hypothetical protein
LHVLSTPPAFVLSQNQTLRKELNSKHVDSGMINARYRNAQKKYLTMPGFTPAKKTARAYASRSAQISLSLNFTRTFYFSGNLKLILSMNSCFRGTKNPVAVFVTTIGWLFCLSDRAVSCDPS